MKGTILRKRGVLILDRQKFKAQVERLAHQLGVATAKNRVQTETKQESKDRSQRPPSTIT